MAGVSFLSLSLDSPMHLLLRNTVNLFFGGGQVYLDNFIPHDWADSLEEVCTADFTAFPSQPV